MSWIGCWNSVFSSGQLAKQKELISQPTTHQYLRLYLHNKTRKRIPKTNPQLIGPAKQNSTNPMSHTPLVRQDTTVHLLTFSCIFVTGTRILSTCKTEISVQNFIRLKTIPFTYFVLLV
jgi:hypothetical protein